MNEGRSILNGILFGRALSQGDALGALPYVGDLIKAAKEAAPNLLREAASKQLSKVQARLQPSAPAQLEYVRPVQDPILNQALTPTIDWQAIFKVALVAGSGIVVYKMWQGSR